ncbi:hypothetical protein SEPCBS57363_000909 [Sporothrix epigloea]|uniref:Uncharacterized protein n=1 Tax=Sporothrix epigloea TaxID=1892477 RepID=A0ABP0D7D8_9PEZI
MVETADSVSSVGGIELFQHAEGSEVDFGALIYDIDLSDFTDADFDFISDAPYKYKLLVFKEQPQMLRPQQLYRLTSSFDPDETTGDFAHGKGLNVTLRWDDGSRMQMSIAPGSTAMGPAAAPLEATRQTFYIVESSTLRTQRAFRSSD